MTNDESNPKDGNTNDETDWGGEAPTEPQGFAVGSIRLGGSLALPRYGFEFRSFGIRI